MLISHLRQDLCLSYANTLCWRGTTPPSETLHDLAGLTGWLQASAGAGAAAARECARLADENPGGADRIFADAIALREGLYRIFSAIAAGSPARTSDIALLQQALAAAPARRDLARRGADYGWMIDRRPPSAPFLLAPVLWSAGDMLVAGARQRIRQCANAKCLWLFFDASKNASRRWCDMASCGNRAKAHRHYLKTRTRR